MKLEVCDAGEGSRNQLRVQGARPGNRGISRASVCDFGGKELNGFRRAEKLAKLQ